MATHGYTNGYSGRAPRPWRARVWFYRPEWDWDWRWIKAWAWKPVYRGGDEFNWHTVVLGFPFTGQVVIATRRCPWTGRCAEDIECYTPEEMAAEWPIDTYGNDHSDPDWQRAAQ